MSQIDFIVPSSDAPHKREWSTHYWYVMFASALQASDKFTDEQADLLVQSFRSLQVSLCCPTCRTHYIAYFSERPYTVEHARDAEKSVAWVKDLRLFIQNRLRTNEAAQITDALNTMREQKICTLPKYPGNLYKQQETQDKIDKERLERAIVSALHLREDNAKLTEPCACATEDMKFAEPTWGL